MASSDAGRSETVRRESPAGVVPDRSTKRQRSTIRSFGTSSSSSQSSIPSLCPVRAPGRSSPTARFVLAARAARGLVRPLQLHQGARFDLADAFARDAEGAADFLERAGVAAAEAVAQFQHLALAVREHRERVLAIRRRAASRAPSVGRGLLVVLAEGSRRAVDLVAVGTSETGSREISRIWTMRSGVVSMRAASSSGVGSRSKLLHQLALDAVQLVDRLDHVHGHADRARPGRRCRA